MRFFNISVHFINAQFHGKRDDTTGEWPPSPLRLYQSLLAGSQTKYRSDGLSNKRKTAFLWLEKQTSPLIITPKVFQSVGYTAYERSNDGDKPDAMFPSSKTTLPCHMLDGNTVHYLWQISADQQSIAQAHIDVLIQEARNLLVLGWGIDMVIGDGRVLSVDEVAQLAGERWMPNDAAQAGIENTLRVPIEGTLEDLFEVHKSSINRLHEGVYHPPIKSTRFGVKHYHKHNSLPRRNFVVFGLESPTEDAPRPRLPQARVAQVAGMLRHLAYSKAERDSFQFPGGANAYVAGHSDLRNDIRRFSYLPLPSIGHQHVDGMIRRVMVSEPYDETQATARWAEKLLFGGELIDAAKRIGVAVLGKITRKDGVISLYTEQSDTWASVTPVLLPGYDEAKYEKALDLAVKALGHAGLKPEMIKDVTLNKAPFWSGALHVNEYFRPKHLKQHAGWHVKLQFYKQVYGPITLGTGRFCGLGLFAAQ